MQAYLELGITTIDTAEIYGLYEVERALGEALALSPGFHNGLEIVTKAGIYVPCKYHADRHTAHYDASGPRIVKSLEKSLRFLGTDHLELFLVHRPDWLTPPMTRPVVSINCCGKARSGPRACRTTGPAQFDLLNSLMERPLATDQVEFHLLHMDPIYDGTLTQCEKAGILPDGLEPFGGRTLLRFVNEDLTSGLPRSPRTWLVRYGGASLEQLAYAWILAHPSRPLPIIGTNRIERMRGSPAAAVEIVLPARRLVCPLAGRTRAKSAVVGPLARGGLICLEPSWRPESFVAKLRTIVPPGRRDLHWRNVPPGGTGQIENLPVIEWSRMSAIPLNLLLGAKANMCASPVVKKDNVGAI